MSAAKYVSVGFANVYDAMGLIAVHLTEARAREVALKGAQQPEETAVEIFRKAEAPERPKGLVSGYLCTYKNGQVRIIADDAVVFLLTRNSIIAAAQLIEDTEAWEAEWGEG